MRIILKVISATGLILTLAPSFFVFFGMIDSASHKSLMLAGTFLWFASAPFWIGKNRGRYRSRN